MWGCEAKKFGGVSHLSAMKGVRIKDWLYHNQTLGRVLSTQHVPVKSALVGAVVEHLEELRSSQVEHELRKNEQKKKSSDR